MSNTTKQVIICPLPEDVNSDNSPIGDKRYHFWSSSLGVLEGKLLTLLEMAITDKEQLKAAKSVIRNTVWEWAENNSSCRRCHNRKKLECTPKCTASSHTHYCPDCNCYEHGPYSGASSVPRRTGFTSE